MKDSYFGKGLPKKKKSGVHIHIMDRKEITLSYPKFLEKPQLLYL